ncbi:MAG: ATP-binding cassette domain-containing protein [Proteobacteria bacterium]|nr:ATP-binding cassette domain-containing protein [Pseudomonadota bacterium]
MQSHFEITFPLIVAYDDVFTISFALQKGSLLEFVQGVYYLHGDNGSGKTTLLNILALTAGSIGGRVPANQGTIKFNRTAYNQKGFNHFKAAELREKYFCIFPQKAFFLPVSTRDNYTILNGSDKQKEAFFSPLEIPDLLSGGQQQKMLMDIVLDEKKAVWFLDEPLTNLDPERRHYFWMTLKKAYQKELKTIFFIDHWMSKKIKNDKNFRHCNTLRVFTENRQKNRPPEIGFRHIEIYENNDPLEFFDRQTRQTEKEKTVTKHKNPLLLRGDWGVTGHSETREILSE